MVWMPALRFAAMWGTLLLLTTASLAGCAGSSGGEEGPVQVSSATPASGSAPQIGTATAGPVTVSNVTLHGGPATLTVTGSVSEAGPQPDQLTSVASNYTATTVLPTPLTVAAGRPLTLGAGSVSLRTTGRIDPGATVAVTFTFRDAGSTQVFATYSP